MGYFAFFTLTDTVAKIVVVGLKVSNKEWRQEFEDLTNPETRTFSGEITDSVCTIVRHFENLVFKNNGQKKWNIEWQKLKNLICFFFLLTNCWKVLKVRNPRDRDLQLWPKHLGTFVETGCKNTLR